METTLKRKTSGLCPEPCLGNFFRRSSLRTFKTFPQLDFLICLYFVRILVYPFAVLQIPDAPAQNPDQRDFVGLRLAPATG